MAIDKVSLCNLALGHVPASEIQNFDTEKSPEALACRRFYTPALENALSLFDWKFASTFTTLTKLASTVPTGGWTYAYAYPASCVKIREILSDNQVDAVNGFGFGNRNGAAYGVAVKSAADYYAADQSYAIGNRQGFGASENPEILFEIGMDYDTKQQVIYTDVDNAVVRFTARGVDSAMWSPEFVMAFSYELGAFLTGQITRDLDRVKWCRNMALGTMPNAAASSDNETPKFEKQPTPSWIRGRET